MQIRMLVLGTVICLMPCGAMASVAARIPIKASITGVMVYQDRAQVTRTATIRLKPGSQTLVFEQLPELLQDDSVRLEASGTARVTIGSIEVKRSFLPRTAEKRTAEIEAEIRQLEHKLAGLDARKSGLTAQKGFIDSIKVAWGERISQLLAVGKPTTAELNEALGFVGTTTVKVEQQQREIDQEKQVTREQIEALQRAKQEAGGAYRKLHKSVEVAVEAAQEGSLNLALSGVVGQATWEPGYDVRLAPDGRMAALTYRAQVRQQTGEDWDNVVLTLSTARPAAGGSPPVLHPWQIGFRRPMPPVLLRQSAGRVAAKAAMAEKADSALTGAPAEPSESAASYQTAQAVTEGTVLSFNVPGTVSISSDNTRHRTVIAQEKLPVSPGYVAVPKLVPDAFLNAELINSFGWPLLPGTVKIFNGGTFVGSAAMQQVAAGEKFTLPFGSDSQVTVKREKLLQRTEAGLFGRNRVTYRITTTVTNFRSDPKNVRVIDQLPLATDSEIRVSLENAALQPTERKNDGSLIWNLQLAAGEKKELRYDIVVEYPKDREVTGL
mgnify:CR=1 FL=1